MFQEEIAGYSISHEDEQRYVDWLNENRDAIIHILLESKIHFYLKRK